MIRKDLSNKNNISTVKCFNDTITEGDNKASKTNTIYYIDSIIFKPKDSIITNSTHIKIKKAQIDIEKTNRRRTQNIKLQKLFKATLIVPMSRYLNFAKSNLKKITNTSEQKLIKLKVNNLKIDTNYFKKPNTDRMRKEF